MLAAHSSDYCINEIIEQKIFTRIKGLCDRFLLCAPLVTFGGTLNSVRDKLQQIHERRGEILGGDVNQSQTV